MFKVYVPTCCLTFARNCRNLKKDHRLACVFRKTANEKNIARFFDETMLLLVWLVYIQILAQFFA